MIRLGGALASFRDRLVGRPAEDYREESASGDQQRFLTWLHHHADRLLIAIWVATLGFLVVGVVGSDPASTKIKLTTSERQTIFIAGCAILTLIVLLIPWERLGRKVQGGLALGSIVLLWPMQYHVLPWTHPHAIIVLLPVIYVAVRHSGRVLSMALILAVIGFWLPVLDGHRTFMDIVDHGIVFVSLVCIAGSTVWLLMERTRNQTRVIDAMAHSDALTGLANRRGWEQQLPRMLAHAARDNRPFSVALIDLNLFKQFNDRLGHQAGDCLLRESARNWMGTVREQDLLSRWGGDEFALALPNCSRDMAARTLTRMAMETPLAQTFCYGIAQWDGEETLETLTSRADDDLYVAKRQSKERRANGLPPVSQGSDTDPHPPEADTTPEAPRTAQAV